MSKIKDITGQRFGRLTVFSFVEKRITNNSRGYFWDCKCDCGKTKIINSSSLIRGAAKSCGCLKREALSKAMISRNTTHGQSIITSEYRCWQSMKTRCFNKNSKNYKHYGGRGITVCERWLKFKNFFEDMRRKTTKTHSLERVDNNGIYCKENCKWATKEEQINNRRSTHNITINGVTKPIKTWCAEKDLNYDRVRQRIYKLKWSAEKALT